MRTGPALEIAERLRRPVTLAFLALTALVFLGPVALLAAPQIVSVGSGVVAVLAALLVAVQVALLVLVVVRLVHVPPAGRLTLYLLLGSDTLALGDAARLAAGVPWGGLGAELLQAAWMAAPLSLWWLAGRPALRGLPAWWVAPLRWAPAAFSLAFLLGALSRIDFRPYSGGPTPPPAEWVFAYGPTLIAIGVSLAGWWTFEWSRSLPAAVLARRLALVIVAGSAAGLLASLHPDVAFVASATITWGTGYQTFRTPEPLPPLAGVFALVGVAAVAYLAVLVRVRRESRVVLFVALAIVLSGVFANPVSVLGSLAGSQLLWLAVTRAGEPPTPGPPFASAFGAAEPRPPPAPGR